MTDLVQKLVWALEWTIRELDRNTCTHEETHRGGAIWTICDGCGMKWADDRGGFKPYKEPAQLDAARAALSEAKAGGWVAVEQAPKHPVCQDGNNHYSEYILAWWPGAIAPTRCRWWFRDDTPACNFVADGGYAVFPTVFQPLPAPPAQRGEG